MIYKIHNPAPPLSQFIDFIFYYEGYHAEHSMEKFLPDGSVDLLIDLTDTPRNYITTKRELLIPLLKKAGSPA